jgi:hypothetical protein
MIITGGMTLTFQKRRSGILYVIFILVLSLSVIYYQITNVPVGVMSYKQSTILEIKVRDDFTQTNSQLDKL